MKPKGGKRAGAGRKPKHVELGMVALLDKAFGTAEREAVIENLVAIAKGDDLKAAVSASTLLLNYTYGKPTEKHEHGGTDGGPLTLRVIYDK